MYLVPTCPQTGTFYAIQKNHIHSIIVKQFLTEQGNQLLANDINDIIILAKVLKIFPTDKSMLSGIETFQVSSIPF